MRSSSCFWTCARRWFVCSMRLRASSSSNSAARAGSATSPRRTAPRERRRGKRAAGHDAASVGRTRRATRPASPRRPPRSLAGVDDVDAAVLGPRRFVVAFAARLFLAEADRLDLDLGGAQQHHQLLHRVGALLAQRDVVLARAALVGVALQRSPARCGWPAGTWRAPRPSAGTRP